MQQLTQSEINKDRLIAIIHPGDVRVQGGLHPPSGLAYIASSLKLRGYMPKVIDLIFDAELKQLNNLNSNAGIYIISFSTVLSDRVRKIIGIIRSVDKNAVILAGGPHPTARKEKIFEEFDIDLIAVGEVEISNIVDAYFSDNTSLALSKIKGIMYKESSKIMINEPADFSGNLDDIPIPSLHDFPIDEYFKIKGYRELSLITSRGCPFRCTFCQPILNNLFGKKIRYQSPKRVVDEIEYFVKSLKLDVVSFNDDTFAFHQQRVIDICKEIIDRKLHFLWRCQTRVGLRRDVLECMKKAGCFLIEFGVESGSQTILDNVHKDTTVEKIIETFKDCKELHILTHSFLSIGWLGESEKTINETAEMLKIIKPFSYSVGIATPYPGTYLWDYLKEQGMLANSDWSKYDHILDDASSIVQLSDFTPQQLVEKKRYLESVLRKVREPKRDIMRLITDKDFLVNFSHILKNNPGFPMRMARLTGRFLIKKGKGFTVINPDSAA